ncbi:LPS assembly lipoprotein LptE [Pelagibius sp. Alg239-R121]|uniref:LPS assembly lipoprotein LptE n=1 Tax=Pelagibius sp. Alg239-R121 TaxID=2993448 RepID=UPI0024A60DA2|nr:LPS assembly lipoprotein LptE [Pelagibius sp. Alg239-R121]
MGLPVVSARFSKAAAQQSGRFHQRKYGLLTATLIASLALTGCGFQPLNSQDSAAASGSVNAAGNGSTLNELAAIRIAPLSDRAGQEMHNLLRDRLNPAGQPTAPKYELQVRLTESIREVAFESDETATRADLSIVAIYQLRRSDNQKMVSTGRSRSVSSYNILEKQFASTISEADARSRTLRDIADDIRIRLAAHFTSARASVKASGS